MTTSGENNNNSALVSFVEAATGLILSDKKDYVRDISHLVQRGIQGKLATGFAEEYAALKKRGSIKEDYEQTDQFRQGASYVFNSINSDVPIDETRFSAIKNIFINAAQEKLSDRDSPLPIVLLRICSTLDEGELTVLATAYRLNRETFASKDMTLRYTQEVPRSWLELIASESGLGVPDMVAHYEETLMDKGLLNKRTPGNMIIADTNYHLSGTGLKLCEFVQESEIFKD